MPVLERQAVGPVPGAATGPFGATPVPPSLAGLPPRSVPETKPTPLEKHYVLLSVPVLILGAIAITALELGRRWAARSSSSASRSPRRC